MDTELDNILRRGAQQKGNWSELLSPLLRPAMIVGVGLAIARQITGINTVVYYASTIFKFAGLSSASVAILASVGVGVVNLMLTVVATQLIDKAERQPLLLLSLPGMALSLFVLGLAFSLHQLSGSLGWIAVASLMVYVGSFAVGLGQPDADIFGLALDIAQAPARQVVYIESIPMFVEIAEGLGIRSILHTDYKSTCEKLVSFGFENEGHP